MFRTLLNFELFSTLELPRHFQHFLDVGLVFCTLSLRDYLETQWSEKNIMKLFSFFL